MNVVDVPGVLFQLLLTSYPQRQVTSSSGIGLLLSRCVRLLRALSRENDVIQRKIFDRAEALLCVHMIHSDIALLVRDVRHAYLLLPHSFMLIMLIYVNDLYIPHHTLDRYVMPNTHRGSRRDSTVELSRVGGVYWALNVYLLC